MSCARQLVSGVSKARGVRRYAGREDRDALSILTWIFDHRAMFFPDHSSVRR